MDLLIQQVLNGLARGSIYAIFGMGFSLVFAIMGTLNVAHGTFATWGALAGLWLLRSAGVHWSLAIGLAFVGGAIAGLLVDRLAFHPLRSREGGLLGPVIASIALWIILLDVAEVYTDAQPQAFPFGSIPDRVFTIGGAKLPASQLLAYAMLVVVLVALTWLVHHSRTGVAMRAVGWNTKSAALAGVNPGVVIVITALVAGGVAGIAGLLAGFTSNNVTFNLGESLFVKGFAAVVVGGFGDIRGAAIGGLLIGVIEVLSAQYVSNSFRDVVSLGLLVLMLLFRPQGILGTREVELRA